MKFNQQTVDRWTQMAKDYLGRYGYEMTDVKIGVEAWDIANHVGILREAYQDRSVIDAHIQTVLEKMFPQCVFRDKKRY